MGTRSGINAPDVWVNDILGNQMPDKCFVKRKNILYMNETHFHHVLTREITLFKWIKAVVKANAFCYFWVKHIRGSLAWYKRR